MTLPTAPALDQPLPDELTGRSQGWFTRYRRYPVFSRPWVLGRWRLWVLLCLLVEGELFDEFAVLWLLLHASHLAFAHPSNGEPLALLNGSSSAMLGPPLPSPTRRRCRQRR